MTSLSSHNFLLFQMKRLAQQLRDNEVLSMLQYKPTDCTAIAERTLEILKTYPVHAYVKL